MDRIKNAGFVLCGLVLGLAMSAPAAQAAESLKVALSTNRILVDGQQVQMTAYHTTTRKTGARSSMLPSARSPRRIRSSRITCAGTLPFIKSPSRCTST